jgi:hypothetical protein
MLEWLQRNLGGRFVDAYEELCDVYKGLICLRL